MLGFSAPHCNNTNHLFWPVMCESNLSRIISCQRVWAEQSTVLLKYSRDSDRIHSCSIVWARGNSGFSTRCHQYSVPLHRIWLWCFTTFVSWVAVSTCCTLQRKSTVHIRNGSDEWTVNKQTKACSLPPPPPFHLFLCRLQSYPKYFCL